MPPTTSRRPSVTSRFGRQHRILTRGRYLSVTAAVGLAMLVGAGVGAAPPAAAGTRTTAPDGWRLVWRDDFNGPAGAGVDVGSWQYDVGHCYEGCPAQNWGTGEVAGMTKSTDNVALDGKGHLLITPRRDAAGRWTSGRLETNRADFAAPEAGAMRVETRLALPAVTGAGAKGYWSAFWMLGATFRNGYMDATGAGDLDVMEHINDKAETVGAVHCGPFPTADPCNEKPDNVGLAGTTTCRSGGCLNGFHTYAVQIHRESTPQRMDWLVDGKIYHTVRADQPGMDAATWKLLVERSFFLILNQSIGGNWPGAPTTETRDGVPLIVDHVAVWVTAAKEPRHDGGGHGGDLAGSGGGKTDGHGGGKTDGHGGGKTDGHGGGKTDGHGGGKTDGHGGGKTDGHGGAGRPQDGGHVRDAGGSTDREPCVR